MVKRNLPEKPVSTTVQAFLEKVAATPAMKAPGRRGRLMFAMDATASREPTWDRACHLQAEMFEVTHSLGGLAVQLCHYRGFADFVASDWLTDTIALRDRMTAVRCLGGRTQIARVLRHAAAETRTERVDALVFVGDCVEEDVDELGALAGELGVLGVPAFMFHEGNDPLAGFAFREIARLTHGAYCRFDPGAAGTLKDLLSAVAVFAAGGRRALEDLAGQRGGEVRQIAHQVKGR